MMAGFERLPQAADVVKAAEDRAAALERARTGIAGRYGGLPDVGPQLVVKAALASSQASPMPVDLAAAMNRVVAAKADIPGGGTPVDAAHQAVDAIDGDEGELMKKCPTCGGSGMVLNGNSSRDCPGCRGSGEVLKSTGRPPASPWARQLTARMSTVEKRAVVATRTVAKATAVAGVGDLTSCQVVKSDPEQRYTLGVAYPALKADVTRAADGRRDFMTAEEVEKTAWRWLTDSRQVGLFHVDGTESAGTVVESYIYRGPSWTVKAANGSTESVEPGDWLLGVVWSPQAWAAIKAGEVGGLSPQGRTKVRAANAARVAQLRRN